MKDETWHGLILIYYNIYYFFLLIDTIYLTYDIYAMMIVFYFKRKHKLVMYVYARLELESILYLRIKYFINWAKSTYLFNICALLLISHP